jgi:hypothetical protein
MRSRHWLLLFALGLSFTIDAAENAPKAAPTLDLKDLRIQKILQASAASQPPESRTAAAAPVLMSLPPPSPRRVHRTECDFLQCVAYASDGRVLYSFPREQASHPSRDDFDGWLSCQQIDDLLSTFERYDKCRGISTGLPLKVVDGVQLRLPASPRGSN